MVSLEFIEPIASYEWNRVALFALIAAVSVLMLWPAGRGVTASTRRHKRFKSYAEKNLDTLKAIPDDARRFGFLRAVNPFVFEEMILTAYERKGRQVIRNQRYTGDGGEDGQVVIGGTRHLIQAKRYKAHIKRADIESFAALCRRRKCPGLFIHTGRTGRASRSAAQVERVKVISGGQLMRMLCG